MATRKSKTAETPASAEAAEEKKPRRAAAKAAPTDAPAAPKRTRKPKAEAAAPAGDAPDTEYRPMHHEERLRHIQEAAYYRAEKRGFTPGAEHDDWIEAEAEIDARQKG